MPRVTSTNCDRLFISCLYHRSLPSLPRNHPFPSVSFAFSILLFFPGSYYGAFLRLHCRDPINQCKIFALTGLTEGPRSHLWALKRVANIANKKQTNCCKLKNINAHLGPRVSPSSLSRLLLPYSGFLPQRLRPLDERILVCPCLSLSSCNFVHTFS